MYKLKHLRAQVSSEFWAATEKKIAIYSLNNIIKPNSCLNSFLIVMIPSLHNNVIQISSMSMDLHIQLIV